MVGLCGLPAVDDPGAIMRVGLVAQRGVLEWADQEADHWENTPGLEVVALRSNVTYDRVLRLALSTPLDLLVLSGHGNAEGVDLRNGVVLRRGQLAQMMRGRIPHLVLNTCESEAIAELIRDETGADVICTVGKVDDQAAYVTGAVLARHLGEGHDFRSAYELSKPGDNHDYRYVPALPGGSAERFRRLLLVAV
jgi:hypothetical protein